MVTVEADVDQVERRLAAGELSCPSCGVCWRAGAGLGRGSYAARLVRWSCARVGRGAPGAG